MRDGQQEQVGCGLDQAKMIDGWEGCIRLGKDVDMGLMLMMMKMNPGSD